MPGEILFSCGIQLRQTRVRVKTDACNHCSGGLVEAKPPKAIEMDQREASITVCK